MKVIGEDREDIAKAEAMIKPKIENAEKIFILGYGFDKTNNKILGLDSIFTNNRLNPSVKLKKEVFITNYENSGIINKIILGQILGQHKNTADYAWCRNIELHKVENLTISTKKVKDAIGSDFTFD